MSTAISKRAIPGSNATWTITCPHGAFHLYNDAADVTVPEPGTFVLFGMMLAVGPGVISIGGSVRALVDVR